MRQSFIVTHKTLDLIDMFGLGLHTVLSDSPSCECIKELKMEKL